MDNEQKERLEQELRFLKESLEAEIITKEEYEKGKERVERKLQETGEYEEKTEDKIRVIKEKEVDEESEEKEEPEVDEDKEHIIIKEIPKEERVKIEPIAYETSKETEENEETQEEEQKEVKHEDKEKKKIFRINKKLVWAAAILVILAVAFIFFPKVDMFKKDVFVPACIDDKDCKAQGKIGACISPNTKEAVCEFKDDAKVQLTVLNDKNCASCSTARMLSVISQLFPNIETAKLDYNTIEGKKLATDLSIDALPAYIFDENIIDANRYPKIKNALTKEGNKYLLAKTASGADYYFKREKIENKLDLFIMPGMEASIKAENNIQEVLDLFGDKIDFTKHPATEKRKDELKQELGITTYPVFLVNNQIKFSGVQAADTIKEKFCELNALVECSITLSQDIK